MKLYSLALAALLPCASLLAEPVVLNLSANATREVANDEMVARLYVQADAQSPAALAREMGGALERTRKEAARYPQLSFAQAAYNSWPEYGKDRKVNGWRGRASVTVSGRDLQAASELVARLQGFMLIENVGFQVSETARRAAQQALIPEALADIAAQARVVGHSLGKPRQAVRELTLNGPGSGAPMPVFAQARFAAANADAAAPDPVNWQPGVSRIGVDASARVELQ
ncbi:SIMPL domain-containing protein [Crenobacter caeni]|uniref:SIMPL domain-containing protein n=1 Tax=Crenobacter caeni TaxID=2705474 RepID=A0A6B2KN98_9NEIS|nr:SIMPL domain-containing protein [Crenobacter caeni]NDV11628.1 SIMPL domain-containing protein [Crenobacter caeni]